MNYMWHISMSLQWLGFENRVFIEMPTAVFNVMSSTVSYAMCNYNNDFIISVVKHHKVMSSVSPCVANKNSKNISR